MEEMTISIMLGKGSISHNNREFTAKNVDAGRTFLNDIFVRDDIREVYHELFDDAMEKYNRKQSRPDRKIGNYFEKIRQGKQEKIFHEVIVQIGNRDNFESDFTEEMKVSEILRQYMKDFTERNPNLRVFNAVIHRDESTPHLHINFVPFSTGNNRGLETRVSLKGALKAQGFVGTGRHDTEWKRWVENEKECLAKVMAENSISWQKKGTHEKHLSVYDYEKKMRAEEVADLEMQLSDGRQRMEQQEKLLRKKKKAVSHAEMEKAAALREKSTAETEQKIAVEETKKAREEIGRLRTKCDGLKEELKSKTEEVEKARNEMRDAKKEQNEIRFRIRTYEEWAEDTRKKYEELLKEYEEMCRKESATKKELEELAADKKKMLEEKNEIAEEKHKLVDEKVTLTEDVLKLWNEKKELASENKKLLDEKSDHTVSLELVKREEENVRKSISELKGEKKKMEDLIENCRAKLEFIKEETEKEYSEYSEVRKQAEEYRESIQVLAEKYYSVATNRREEEMFDELIELRTENTALKKENKKLKDVFEKACDYMKTLVVNGISAFTKFMESIGAKPIENAHHVTGRSGR